MCLHGRVLGGESRERAGHSGAVDRDCIQLFGKGAQWGWDMDLHCVYYLRCWLEWRGCEKLSDDDLLVGEGFVFFAGASEEEAVGDGGFAGLLVAVDCGDDIGAAEPVGLGEIGRGPLRGVVGVGVVEGDRPSRWAAMSSCGAMW
jgi:hypothetical protein